MAILITTYGEPQQITPKGRAHFTLQELQAFVGGYLEVVGRLPDGRLRGATRRQAPQLPVNARAPCCCGRCCRPTTCWSATR
jgi:hypothetical protein